MIPCKPSLFSPFQNYPLGLASMASNRPPNPACFPARIKSMATDRAAVSPPQKRPISASEARISLVFALTSQASTVSQRRKCSYTSSDFIPIRQFKFWYWNCWWLVAVLMDLVTETAKYVFPKRFESRTLEEALMSGNAFFLRVNDLNCDFTLVKL